MERIRELDGVLWVNDSKATNATSSAPALAAYPVVHWILGGQAKTDDLDACAPHYGHVKAAYVIGDAADLFERLLSPHMPVTNAARWRWRSPPRALRPRRGDSVCSHPPAPHLINSAISKPGAMRSGRWWRSWHERDRPHQTRQGPARPSDRPGIRCGSGRLIASCCCWGWC
jgi:hypothetical protein